MGLQQQALSQQMQQFLMALQFQQQQSAMQNAMNLGTQYGYAPGGSWTSWPTSQSMQPLPGTPTQSMQAQAMNNALQTAGVTGQFINPSQMMYQPGSFVRNSDTGAIGQIQATGGVRTFGSMQEYLAAGGTQAAVNQMPQLTNAEYGNLGTQGQTAQPTLQAAGLTGMYQGAPTAAYQQQLANLAAQNAQLTGTYYDPSQMQYQPGSFVKDATTGGIGQIMPNGQLKMFGSMDEFTQAGGNASQIAGLPSVPDAQYYNMATSGQAPGQQTLQSINQAAQLSGMYQGAPTEAAREFNANLALGQGQLGQQYLATAAQLQGPQNTFQLSNYLRGAQGNPNVPTYLSNLANNTAGQMAAFQGAGSTTPTPQSAQGLMGQMAGGQSATPGWDYGSTLGAINSIAQQGGQSLAPGSLERLTPDEMAAFGSGLGAAGYSLPSFMAQYNASRVGQQAPVGMTSLA